jgi:DNA-binding NarL/FixJ family response regulator
LSKNPLASARNAAKTYSSRWKWSARGFAWLTRIRHLVGRLDAIQRKMGRGLSNAQVATELFVSETTMTTHVAHALPTLGLRDRVQAPGVGQ